uniref:Phospholipid transport system substrate-binding protein n=1 Tax=Candidatus Kentrum sp. FW TaxID=2126338 RepID=A0A450U2D5_9GAMM|nr:MAG: phospholipid transport system substrate-binding protein [Candidatus Kentron sp. FW]
MTNAPMTYRNNPTRYYRFPALDPISRRAIYLCWTVILVFFPLAHQAQDRTVIKGSPEQAIEIVRETSNHLLESIEKEDLRVDKDHKRLYEVVNKIVFDKFDFRRMSSRVLGKNWRKATAEQKEQFTEQFKAYLVFTYAMALKEYNGERIEYLPIQSRKSSSRIKVQTRVHLNDKSPLDIDYVLSRSQEREWKVTDVLVAGVSLVITYRSSFQAEIDRIGISGLIAKLKEKNSRFLSPDQS